MLGQIVKLETAWARISLIVLNLLPGTHLAETQAELAQPRNGPHEPRNPSDIRAIETT
jgi:hypothetical protein